MSEISQTQANIIKLAGDNKLIGIARELIDIEPPMSCSSLGRIVEMENSIIKFLEAYQGSPMFEQIKTFIEIIADARREIANINGDLRNWGFECLQKVIDLELAIDDRDYIIKTLKLKNGLFYSEAKNFEGI